MFLLILILSCTVNKFRIKEKVRREDITEAIHSRSELSRSILEEVSVNDALTKNNEGLLPIEEAIIAANAEAVKVLMNIASYTGNNRRVYERVVETRDALMFDLIPREELDYKLLVKIRENRDAVLEYEFLNKIEATELERLILRGQYREIKAKSKTWMFDNYKHERNPVDKALNSDGQMVTTPEFICLYGENLIDTVIEKLEKEIYDIKEHFLLSASKLGKIEIVESLLRKGVDFNKAIDPTGYTAAMAAAFNKHIDICKLLIENGDNASAADPYGHTLLMIAVQIRSIDLCNFLISKGANIRAGDIHGRTALISAACEGYTEICQILIERGADVNETEEDGETALMRAVAEAHEDTCRLLIEKGAEIDAQNLCEWTALMFADYSENESIKNLLIENGADVGMIDNESWRFINE